MVQADITASCNMSALHTNCCRWLHTSPVAHCGCHLGASQQTQHFQSMSGLHHEVRRAQPYLILEASQCSQIDEDSLIFPHCNVISRHISMQQAHICQGCNDASHLQYNVSVSARPQKSSSICLNVPLYIAYLQQYYS